MDITLITMYFSYTIDLITMKPCFIVYLEWRNKYTFILREVPTLLTVKGVIEIKYLLFLLPNRNLSICLMCLLSALFPSIAVFLINPAEVVDIYENVIL